MGQLTVSGLDDVIIERLKSRAAGNHRSLEAEVREILARATRMITLDDRPDTERRATETPDAGQRPAGLCAGEFEVPDDFDAPLELDEAAEMQRRLAGRTLEDSPSVIREDQARNAERF